MSAASLLKPLPFANPDRLLSVYENGKRDSYNVVAGGIYSEWKKYNQSFSHLAAVQSGEFEVSGTGGQLPERNKCSVSSWELLSTLGFHPSLGRDFSAGDDGPSANGSVFLSWSLWQRRFGSDPGIVGRTIDLNAKPYTVIGVMPAWYVFPEPSTQLWTALYHDVPPGVLEKYDNHGLEVVGRLKPGVSASQATADLSAISLRIHNQHLDDPFVFNAALTRPLLEHMVGRLKRPSMFCLRPRAAFSSPAQCCQSLVARAAARRRRWPYMPPPSAADRLRLLRERLIELVAFGGRWPRDSLLPIRPCSGSHERDRIWRASTAFKSTAWWRPLPSPSLPSARFSRIDLCFPQRQR